MENLTTCLYRNRKYDFLKTYQDLTFFLKILKILNNVGNHYKDILDNEMCVVMRYLNNFLSYPENNGLSSTCTNTFKEVHLAMLLEQYNKLFFIENLVKVELRFINILKIINFNMLIDTNDLYNLLGLPCYTELTHIPLLYDMAKILHYEIDNMVLLIKRKEKLSKKKTIKTLKNLYILQDKTVFEQLYKKIETLDNEIKKIETLDKK